MGILTLILVLSLLSAAAAAGNKRTYIVQMSHDEKPASYNTHDEWYSDVVQSLTKSPPSDSILYTYKESYHGFAAAMSAEEAQSLRQSSSVVRVIEDKPYYHRTTRTPLFLGLEVQDLWTNHTLGDLDEASQNVVIGFIDFGVWPESKSYLDDGMKDVPKWWGGKCDSNFNFCNKKLIGARAFLNAYNTAMGITNKSGSPRDDYGHGSHTSSIAAGSLVANASLFGMAGGNARGVAHRARIAVYKVCGNDTICLSSDILAGMDAAIQDGVNVMSVSLGGDPMAYDEDIIYIGTFAAMARGIFVSCSAGNEGPEKGTVENVAPWITTVGAGTIDREFRAFASLGNGEYLTGASLHTGNANLVKLVYGGGKNKTASMMCLAGSLDNTLVRGKVVLCDMGPNRAAKGLAVKDAGGVGMVIANTVKFGGEDLEVDSHLLPTVAMGNEAGNMIREYVRKAATNATILLSFKGMELNIKPSPTVISFSSRGPNAVTPQILKPDVIAPGLNILAAWSGNASPTRLPTDTRRTDFNIASGTSMSCPHVSGLAALLKAAHPEWSPSAIKSALMTTAYTRDNTGSLLRDMADNSVSTPWAHGAGHVDLHKALSPGLLYDASPEDYTKFLCSINYTIERVRAIVRNNVTCNGRKFDDPGQLNYPSFSVIFGASVGVVKYSRELTNVEDVGSTYQVYVESPPNVSINVQPSELVFEKVGDKNQYVVTFTTKKGVGHFESFGSITWKNEKNRVTSPVSFQSTGF